jgi:eukaryotic-like serine/threonine-protein kinase
MTIDPNRVQAVFLAAIASAGPTERATVLNEQCGDDGPLRARVEALLQAHDQSGALPGPGLRDMAGAPSATVIGSLADAVGITIAGRYKLLEAIGEGGMGTVWVAQQNEPVRRRVALKLVKAGMDSRQVLSRFELERQALALMDHPNIAKVLDGGVTDQGRPFFVMEYVKGVPITEFCDQARVTVDDRLRLFVQVCQAVQHAHQKGIIHRDLKPSNILVCLYDGKPVPKVIDFGLAKAMHQPLTEHTLYTAHGLMLGTPLYMSPEQAEFNNLDIDTRTDVYSLGVILYELLTGTTPLDRQQFKDAAWQEILRLIKEDEPSKPSTKLSGSGSLPSIAAQRSLEPAQLSRLVRGDLDWIVMKSLEKERSRRYETANGIARDIERYLNDQPVEACPPSASYRFRKFARRNRVALTSMTLVALALVGGILTSTWQAVRARQAEARAQLSRAGEAAERKRAESEREEAQQQRAAAEANLQKARAAVDKYFTLVSESTLLDVPGLQPLRGKLLGAALEFYQSQANETVNDPAALADLAAAYMRFAEINHVNDRNDDAIAALGKGIDLIGRLRREFPQAREQSRKLAGFWKGYRREFVTTMMPSDPKGAFQIINRAAEAWQALAEEHPAEPAFRSDLAAILYHTGELLTSGGQVAEGVRYLERSVTVQESLSRDYPKVAEYRADLARSFEQLGRNLPLIAQKEQGEANTRKALAIREQLVADLPDVPQHQMELATSLELAAGSLMERDARQAELLLRREIELTQRLATAQYHAPPYLNRWATAHGKLLYMLTVADRTGEADDLIRRATEFIHRLEAEHPDARWLQVNLANAYYSCAGTLNEHQQLYPKRIEFWKKAIALHEGAMADPAYPAASLEQLGHSYRMVGGRENHTKAADVFARLLAAHPSSAFYRDFEVDSLSQVAHFLMDESKFKEAEPYLRHAVAIRSDAPQLHLVQARLLESQNKLTEALTEARAGVRVAPLDYEAFKHLLNILNHIGDKEQTIAIMREHVAAAPKGSNGHCVFGLALAQQDRHEEAIAEFRKCRELAPSWEWPHLLLADELLKLHKRDEALAEMRTIHLEKQGWYSYFLLGRLWEAQGHYDEGLKHLLQAAAREPDNGEVFQAVRSLVNSRAGSPEQKSLLATADQAFTNTRHYVDWCAICGHWREVATEFEKRIAANPDDHYPWYQAAFILAIAGDVKKYRAHCTQMLERFKDTQDPYTAERVCKASLILEAPADQMAKLRALAERSVTIGAKHGVIRYFQLAQALADYRAGQYASSREWVQKCLHSDKDMAPYGVGMAKLLAAMCESRLGNKDEARAAWDEARKFCADRPHVDRGQLLFPGDWHDGLGLELLFREAERLFQSPPPADAKKMVEAPKPTTTAGAQKR